MIFPIGNDVPQIHPTAFIHPSAEISGKVKIGARVSVWGGCILRGDINWIEVGADSNLQDGSIFHTSEDAPVVIGERVTVGHRATIHGATVEQETLIGMGAILLDHSLVEKHCLIAAGALIKEKGHIPEGHLAVGVPAKAIRKLNASEIEMIVSRAGEYVAHAAQYQNALKSARLIS